MIPIRCITCNKVLANLYEKYLQMIKLEHPQHVLTKLGCNKYCCRKTFITNIN